MELIIITITIIVAIITVNLMMKINPKELEKIALNTELNKMAEKYPENKEICKTILSNLRNENTKIEENTNSDLTLYIAIENKILIGNMHNSFTRIQTIAHECLHSIQDKKILIFNFIYSNIYFLYLIIICILITIKKLPHEIIHSNILIILGFIYYVIRTFLENDAMIKAEYVAKEYMEQQNISSKEEIEEICKGLKKINSGCIKGTNCSLFTKTMIKVVIFNVLALIF